MTEALTQIVPGHDCNAYCRPEEGEHCEATHLWSLDPNMSVDEALTLVPLHQDFLAAGRAYRRVRQEYRPEIAPITAREATEIHTKAMGRPAFPFDHFHWIGGVLVWFVVPLEPQP